MVLENKIDGPENKIDDLERQVRSTSRNSSKPPSSDGLAEPSPKVLASKGARKPGGQPGHQGTALKQVAILDTGITHAPATGLPML